jgi:hypothetical protein
MYFHEHIPTGNVFYLINMQYVRGCVSGALFVRRWFSHTLELVKGTACLELNLKHKSHLKLKN